MVYATYHDYWLYCGETDTNLQDEVFKRLERRARAYLDDLTDGRIAVITQAVRDATCACVEILARQDDVNAGRAIQSESNDGWSVTYAVGGPGDATSFEARLYEAARLYLGHTGLLYRGVEPC